MNRTAVPVGGVPGRSCTGTFWIQEKRYPEAVGRRSPFLVPLEPGELGPWGHTLELFSEWALFPFNCCWALLVRQGGKPAASSHSRKSTLALHGLHLAHEILLVPALHHLPHLPWVLPGQQLSSFS